MQDANSPLQRRSSAVSTASAASSSDPRAVNNVASASQPEPPIETLKPPRPSLTLNAPAANAFAEKYAGLSSLKANQILLRTFIRLTAQAKGENYRHKFESKCDLLDEEEDESIDDLMTPREQQQEEEDEKLNFTAFNSRHVIGSYASSFDIVAQLICCLILFAAYGYLSALQHLIEALLLLFFVFCNVTLHWHNARSKHNELLRILCTRIESLQRLPLLGSVRVSELPPSSQAVHCYRDDEWRFLPLNALVRGDLIEVDEGDALPCEANEIKRPQDVPLSFLTQSHASHQTSAERRNSFRRSAPDEKSEAQPESPAAQTGDVRIDIVDELLSSHEIEIRSPLKSRLDVSPLIAGIVDSASPALADNAADAYSALLKLDSVRYYIVRETPIVHQVRHMLQAHQCETRQDRPPETTFENKMKSAQQILRVFLCALVVVHVILALIRLGISDAFHSGAHEPRSRKDWFYSLFYQSVLISLPLIGLLSPLWLSIWHAFGNSALIVSQLQVQRRTEDGTGPSSELTLEDQQRLQRESRRDKRNNFYAGAHTHQGDTESEVSRLDGATASHSDASSPSRTSSSSSGTSYSDADEEHSIIEFMDSLDLPAGEVMRHAIDIFKGRSLYVTRSVNPLLTLGDVTIFCCLDNEGILSENEPSPDHLVFFHESKEASHQATAAAQQHQLNAIGDSPLQTHDLALPRDPNLLQLQPASISSSSKPIVLDLLNDPTSASGLVIEGEWSNYLDSLKPLGLSAILNNACNLRSDMACQYDFTCNANATGDAQSDNAQTSVGGCLCALGSEIGFDVAHARHQFWVSKAIYTVGVQQDRDIRPKRRKAASKPLRQISHKPPAAVSQSAQVQSTPGLQASTMPALGGSVAHSSSEPIIRMMTAISVIDRYNPLGVQLLTSGDPLLLLTNCSDYWDGHSLRPMSDTTRAHLLSIYKQWNHQDLKCVAFGFCPVTPAQAAAFVDDRPVSYLIENMAPPASHAQAAQSMQTMPQANEAEAEADQEADAGIEQETPQLNPDEIRLTAEDGALVPSEQLYDASHLESTHHKPLSVLNESTEHVDEISHASAAAHEDLQSIDRIHSATPDLSNQLHLNSLVESESHHSRAVPSSAPHTANSLLTSSVSPAFSSFDRSSVSIVNPSLYNPSTSQRHAGSFSLSGSLSANGSNRSPDLAHQLPPPACPPPPNHAAAPAPSAAASAAAAAAAPLPASTASALQLPLPAQSTQSVNSLPASAINVSASASNFTSATSTAPASPKASAVASVPLSALSLPLARPNGSLSHSISADGIHASSLAASAKGAAPQQTQALSSRNPNSPTFSSTSAASNSKSTAVAALPLLEPLLNASQHQPAISSHHHSKHSRHHHGRTGSTISNAGGAAGSTSLTHSQSHFSLSQFTPNTALSKALNAAALHHQQHHIHPHAHGINAHSALTQGLPLVARNQNATGLAPIATAATSAATSQTQAAASNQAAQSIAALKPVPLGTTAAGAANASALPTGLHALPEGASDAASIDDSLQVQSELFKQLQSRQVFMGLVAMRDQPKTEVRALVEQLKVAGVRFVYFSPENERKTQAFGTKIGLQCDFNSFVSLKDPVSGYSSSARQRQPLWQGKSQLPCGISAVREHLRRVDDVPLLVSLFTDCEPHSIQEMLRIYQENGEQTLCLGSTMHSANSDCFLQSNLSASLNPIPSKQCPYAVGSKDADDAKPAYVSEFERKRAQQEEAQSHRPYTACREFATSSALTSMPCALPLCSTSDLQHFIAAMCCGRTLLNNTTQACWYAAQMYAFIATLLCVQGCCDMPPFATAYQLFWLCGIQVPLLAIGIAASPRENDVMLRLPAKNGESTSRQQARFVFYFIVQCVPSIAIALALFLWLLHTAYKETNAGSISSDFYWQLNSTRSLQDESRFRSTLLLAQVYTQCALLLILVTWSLSFVHRHYSLRRYSPFEANATYTLLCCAVILMQLAFTVVSVFSRETSASIDISGFHWYIFFLWPILCVLCDEAVKYHDTRIRDWHHKMARFRFDTVLGLHSPV